MVSNISTGQNSIEPIGPIPKTPPTRRARLETSREYKFTAAAICALVGVALFFVPKARISSYALLTVAAGLAISAWRDNVLAHRCKATDSKFAYKRESTNKPSLQNRVENVVGSTSLQKNV